MPPNVEWLSTAPESKPLLMIDAKLIFTLLGPLFLVLGMWRAVTRGPMSPQARAGLLVGAIFSAVAAWLWSRSTGLPWPA